MEKNFMEHRFLVPVLTPKNADDSVNYDALQKLVARVIEQGADGIYAVGSSAECWMLTTEQRKAALEAVIEAANGKYVVAHIGSVGLNIATDLAKHAEKAGADMIASVPPFYFGFNFDEVKYYFDSLASCTSLPMMIYNIPGSTGKSFTIDQLASLLDNPQIPCMKYTDIDYFALEQLKSKSGKFLYSGSDERFISALAAGADGAIGTTFNLMVDRYAKIRELFKAGDVEGALKIQKSCNRITAATFKIGCLPAFKYLAGLNCGADLGDCFKPFKPITDEQKAWIRGVAEEEGAL